MINRAADKRGVAMTSNLKDEVEFSRWAQRLVGELTPIRERFTPFPLYFQTQIFNFVVMRRLLREYFPFDRPHEFPRNRLRRWRAFTFVVALATRCSASISPASMPAICLPNFKSSVDVSRALVNEMYGITNATFEDAFPNRLPCEADSVDLIFSWTVLEHIPNLRESYAEMLRVLKPGGVATIHVAPVTMSAIATIASVNVEEAKKRAIAPAALGWLGAARTLWSNYVDLAKGRPARDKPEWLSRIAIRNF